MTSTTEQESRVVARDELVADGYSYKIDIYTADVYGAGTDASVLMTIYGEDGNTGQQLLDNAGNNFERGTKDHFQVVSQTYLGRITKIRIGHDNSGIGPAWMLGKVTVEDVKSHEVFEFPCNRWLSTEEDDGSISRDLTWTSVETKNEGAEGHYTLHIYTGDVWGAGTDANVIVTIYGTKGDSGEHKLENEGENNFERNMKDTFKIKCSHSLGTVYKVRVGHDNTGWGPGWYLGKVAVEDDSTGVVVEFTCERWFATDADDGLITRELMREGFVEETDSGLGTVKYTVTIFTGNVWGAGTDANILLTLYGTAGESEEFQIENEGQTTFECGMKDTYQFDCSYLDALTKIRIGHDNTGWGPGWFLDKVTVDDPKSGETAVFPCGKWFATDADDGLITRDLIREGGTQHKIIIDGQDTENLKGEPLGMESHVILDDKITASSHADPTPPSNARLNNNAAWCTADSNDCWLQVDLGRPHCVTSVATQGNPTGNNDYVKKYKILYSDDGENWNTHEENGNQIFDANEDSDTAKTITLQQVVVARYVRFCPVEWYCWPCLRVEVYGIPVKESKTEVTTVTNVVEEVVVAEDDAVVESAPPEDESEKAKNAIQNILNEEITMAAAEERRKKIEEEKKQIDDEMKKLEDERKEREKQKEEERKLREEEAKKKQEEEERRKNEEEENKKLEEQERKKRVEAELKKIDDEHKLRVEALDKQVRDEEEKLRKEREQNEKAEGEELRRWEEEMKRKEEEAQQRQDEERRKIEEEKQRWNDEREAREDEFKKKHEEEQRKREEEWKLKEEMFAKGLQNEENVIENDKETVVITTVTEVVVQSSPDDERTDEDWQEEDTDRNEEDEEERRRREDEERRQKIEDERRRREEDERKRLEEAEELNRIMIEMRKKADREDEEKQKEAEEEEQRKKEEAKRIKEEENRKTKEADEKKRLETEVKIKKKAEKERMKIIKKQRKRSLTGSTSSMSSASSSSSSSGDEEEKKWVSNVDIKGFNAPIADMDDDEEGVTRMVTYRTKTTTTTRVVSWPGAYYFKPIEPGQTQPTLPEEVGVIFNLEDVNPYRGQACCDHLKPVDPAVKTAQESSFSEKLTEDSRPVSAWYGDTGSILQLYTPFSAIRDDDVDRLLDWEAEGTQGWKRIKKSRDCEVWTMRSFEGGPPVTKALITLNGVPYSEAVQLLRDWNTRKEWDKTFDSVEVIDTIDESHLIHCPVKKRDFVLATLDREDKDEQFFASAWRNTNHPNTNRGKNKPLKLDYLFSGLVVRPIASGVESSRITILCQVKGVVPSQAKSTFLAASPQKWMADLKKFYNKKSKEIKEGKTAQES